MGSLKNKIRASSQDWLMRFLFFIAMIFMISCGDPVATESRADKLAKSICGCTTALLELNKPGQASADSLAFRNIATAYDKTKACVAALGIKPEDREALTVLLPIKCPELAQHEGLVTELLAE